VEGNFKPDTFSASVAEKFPSYGGVARSDGVVNPCRFIRA